MKNAQLLIVHMPVPVENLSRFGIVFVLKLQQAEFEQSPEMIQRGFESEKLGF